MRYQIDEKIKTIKYRYIRPLLMVFACRIVKCLLELEMPNMLLASTKFYFPKESTIE